MNLITLFQARNKSFYLLLVFLGIVRSLTNIGILVLINNTLSGHTISFLGSYSYVGYIVLIGLSFLSSAFFQRQMVRFNNEMMFNLEMSLIQKVRRAAYESFEKMGYQKIYAALGDARFLGRIPEVFITLINAVITIICSLAYLFWTSSWSGFVVLIVMGFLLGVYVYRDRRIAKDMNKIRDLQDLYYDSLRELLVGFKQVRISAIRNRVLFHKHLLVNRERSKSLSINVSTRYLINELIGTYSWYVLFGIIIFVLPTFFKMNMLQVAVFITSVLFMMAPISQLVMFFPVYNSFRISVERIDRINMQLEEDARSKKENEAVVKEFSNFRFENVTYRYGQEETAFGLEIADFSVRKGESVFIVGGNGSGKTTFINILTGLYKPIGGKVFLNNQEISWDEFHDFSNSMGVVFTDHHMFGENYDEHDLSEDNAKFTYFRTLVNLDGIMRLDEKGKADIRLSKGQQKRLALLLALLENKPLVILDEWAAEQDPKNRKYFYTELLETLKAMDKTVIAISHDDDFYEYADRIVRFDYGKISSDTKERAHSIVN